MSDISARENALRQRIDSSLQRQGMLAEVAVGPPHHGNHGNGDPGGRGWQTI